MHCSAVVLMLAIISNITSRLLMKVKHMVTTTWHALWFYKQSGVTHSCRLIIFLNVIHWCLVIFWTRSRDFLTASGFFFSFFLITVPTMWVKRLPLCFPFSCTEQWPWKAESVCLFLSFSFSLAHRLFLNSCWQQDVITDGQLRGNLKPEMYFCFSCCQATVQWGSELL